MYSPAGLNIASAAGVPGVVGFSGLFGVSPACNLLAKDKMQQESPPA